MGHKAPNPSKKRRVTHYTHPASKRLNNPPVGLVTPETDKDAGKKYYAYDPHLDPSLQWAGKAERTSFDISTVSLHVHERIDSRSIIEAVRKKNGEDFVQGSLFSQLEENPPLREAVDFYKHKHNWSNRLIAGDSLLVMNSLLEKEGMAGKVQMVYFDPPYGISYGSNFQPFVNNNRVKDGKDDDLTAQPEMIKAFRDTWELGIHSYLTYLRDRFVSRRHFLVIRLDFHSDQRRECASCTKSAERRISVRKTSCPSSPFARRFRSEQSFWPGLPIIWCGTRRMRRRLNSGDSSSRVRLVAIPNSPG